ncbi:MAG: polyprenyl synthetase family protein [Deltaproteobacteria bacterium]|nr:polyprenyl synthetase family protein [Deltaproteobacteria bacterium]
MDALDYLSHCAARLDPHLAAQAPADGAPQVLYEAMRHLLVPGGKRLRPGFAFAACEAAGAPPERALPAALAVELLHTYSLIHDDLPCMDNSPTRRGAPSVHARFGEAVALLAGDALQALAFEALIRAANAAGAAAAVGAAGAIGAAGLAGAAGAEEQGEAQRAAVLGALHDLATAAGPRNLVGGQCDDLAFAGIIGDAPAVAFGAAASSAPAGEPGAAAAEAAAVESVHLRKSAALIAAALTAGARLGGAGPELVARLRGFGEQVGVAFQIVDDLLDHAQENPEPCSLARVLGAPAARKRAESLLEAALKRIADLGPEADALRALARYALQRER